MLSSVMAGTKIPAVGTSSPYRATGSRTMMERWNLNEAPKGMCREQLGVAVLMLKRDATELLQRSVFNVEDDGSLAFVENKKRRDFELFFCCTRKKKLSLAPASTMRQAPHRLGDKALALQLLVLSAPWQPRSTLPLSPAISRELEHMHG